MTYYIFKKALGDNFNTFYQTLEKWKDVEKDDVDIFIQRLDSLFNIICEKETTQKHKMKEIYKLFKTALLNNLENLPKFLEIKDIKEVNIMSDNQQVIEAPQVPQTPQSQEEIIKQIEANINTELRFCEETCLRAIRGCMATVVNILNSVRK
jgi:hypothetical protein